MAYTVLARRYRSTSFDELVGQEPIARTLQNAIAADKVAHAYLFTGTRGVGKTSSARIFAKALNAPGDEPKDVADAIMAGRDTDVIEIDAASNNSVEQARELIAASVYRPMRGRRKIYIIDEVHMLSPAAFNALLKTMEEPPDHVVFILCTTETHKVPATIQSRCQRFDFRNIPPAEVARHLGDVLQREGLDADPDLLNAVARLGNGSMRDSLSLLDRLIACGERRLTLKLLDDLLGLPDRELVGGLVDSIASGDPRAALEQADQLLRRGVSPDLLIDTLLDRLRDLMVIGSCGPQTDILTLSAEARAEEARRAARFDTAGLVHAMTLCENTQRSIRGSSTPRPLLDALIVRLALAESMADLATLINTLEPGLVPPREQARPAPVLAEAGSKKR
jgi:DNA polymerase-3 subunit gamma/tau